MPTIRKPRIAKRSRSLSGKLPSVLTEKQRAFADLYVLYGNQSRAAREAGYADRTEGYQLMQHPHIADYIAEKRAQSRDKLKLTTDTVAAELKKIGMANLGDYIIAGADGMPVLNLEAMDRDQAAALQEIIVERVTIGSGKNRKSVPVIKRIRLGDKKGALDSLMRHLGGFIDRTEVTGAAGGPIETSTVPAREVVRERLKGIAGRIKPQKGK